MLMEIAAEVYSRYVMADKKGTPVLYVKLQKALYGLMRASLLFYRKLRLELEAYRFKVNPYDPCVAILTTCSGKQLIVKWHVNDLMVLCEEDFELTKFSCYLARIYGTKLSMNAFREGARLPGHGYGVHRQGDTTGINNHVSQKHNLRVPGEN
jgi:hypothetical protein